MKCIVRQGLFDRWYIFSGMKHVFTLPMAWSGSKWVPATMEGLPTGGVQVCNFTTEQEARDYCGEHELDPQ